MNELLQKRLDEIKTRYEEDAAQHSFKTVILGVPGAGKTALCATAPGPILIDSFDAGGTKTINNLSTVQHRNDIYIDTRWEDKADQARTYNEWERDFEDKLSKGFFNDLGTYCLDSFTWWSEALIQAVGKVRGKKIENFDFKDYNILHQNIKLRMNKCASLPCNFVLTAHLEAEKDELLGRVRFKLQATPGIQKILPSMFDDMWVLDPNEAGGKITRRLITSNTGIYLAKNRYGDKIDLYEEPDLMKLREKVCS